MTSAWSAWKFNALAKAAVMIEGIGIKPILLGRISGRRFLKSRCGHCRQRENLIKLTVEKLHCYLDAVKAILMGKINRSSRMLKIKSFVRIGGPIAQSTKVKPRARVLQENFHTMAFVAFCSCRSDQVHQLNRLGAKTGMVQY